MIYNVETEIQLKFIRENLTVLTNKEIAEKLKIKEGQLTYLQMKYKIFRTQQQRRKLFQNISYRFEGELNGNWKGGISKDNMRYKKLQIERYPERIRARQKAEYALKTGKIEKKNCELCNDENVQMHHEDHSKPLQVIFLCPVHHRMADKFLRNGIKFETFYKRVV